MTHLEMIQQRFQSPVRNARTPEAERMDMLGGHRKRVDQVEDVLVGGAAQAESVEAPLEQRSVQTGPFHSLAAPQLAALQDGDQALPVTRIPVEDVPPANANLNTRDLLWCLQVFNEQYFVFLMLSM